MNFHNVKSIFGFAECHIQLLCDRTVIYYWLDQTQPAKETTNLDTVPAEFKPRFQRIIESYAMVFSDRHEGAADKLLVVRGIAT